MHNEESFTRSQHTVASYLREHMESIAFSNLETLAGSIGVSTTTVIRFARAIGYNGFSEMQNAVQNELQQKMSLPDRLEGMVYENSNQVLKESFETDMENIRLTMAAQNDEDLRLVAEWVANADNMYILGMRSSFSIAYYMASRLGEIKRNVRLIQSTGMLYPEEIVGADVGDVCIAYLFPRYSKTTANILQWLRVRGVKIIIITAMNYSTVQQFGDIILPCSIQSTSYKNSLTAPVCLTNYLLVEFVRKNYSEAKEVLARTESILNRGYYLGL